MCLPLSYPLASSLWFCFLFRSLHFPCAHEVRGELHIECLPPKRCQAQGGCCGCDCHPSSLGASRRELHRFWDAAVRRIYGRSWDKWITCRAWHLQLRSWFALQEWRGPYHVERTVTISAISHDRADRGNHLRSSSANRSSFPTAKSTANTGRVMLPILGKGSRTPRENHSA